MASGRKYVTAQLAKGLTKRPVAHMNQLIYMKRAYSKRAFDLMRKRNPVTKRPRIFDE